MSAISDSDTDRTGPDTPTEEDLSEFQTIKRDVLAGHRHRTGWRKQAKKSYEYVSGHQWSEEDERLLNEQNRPTVVFNRVAPIVKAVCGLEVNNRQGVVYLPREMGDVGVNETITSAAKWVRDECGAEDEESTAFRDMVICGEGWTETRMDYDDDPTGKIVQERIYPLEMGVNKGSRKANHSDARLIYRVRDLALDDARAILGLDGVLASAIHVKWMEDFVTPADGGEGNKKDYPDETRSGLTTDGKQPDTVRVVQCQYSKRESVMIVAQEGVEELQTLDMESFKTFEQRAAMTTQAAQMDPNIQPINYQATKVPKKVWYECFLINNAVVGKRKLETGPQFRAMTAEYDEKEKYFYGMVPDMFDPQMWANKWLSQTMNIMNSNAKGGIIAESDAFQNIKKAEENWSDPTKMIIVKPGTLGKGKIKDRTPAPLPQGLSDLMGFAISSIRDVSGVNLEMLGQADREQAASLEAQRRQSAMTILATMFDSLRKYRKSQGRLLLHFIWMLPDGTLVRVLEQGKHKYIPLVKDKSVEKYDVIIDQAPSSPDQKQFIWAVTAQILQIGILPPQAVVELLKYSPYPESVVAEIRAAMGMDGQMSPEQMKQKLQQAEQALQVLEQQLQQAMEAVKTAEDEKAVEMMKLEIDEYKAETERLRVQLDARAKFAALAQQPEEGGDETTSQPSGGAPTIGAQTLPDSATQGSGDVNAKLDQLAAVVGQLVQALGQGGAPQEFEPVPPIQPAPPEVM